MHAMACMYVPLLVPYTGTAGLFFVYTLFILALPPFVIPIHIIYNICMSLMHIYYKHAEWHACHDTVFVHACMQLMYMKFRAYIIL